MNTTQKQVLTFTQRFIDENGYSPSYREIIAGTSITSLSVVKLNLEKLEEQGYLSLNPKKSRSIVLHGDPFDNEPTPEETVMFVQDWHHVDLSTEIAHGAECVVDDGEQRYIAVYDHFLDKFMNKPGTRSFDNIIRFMVLDV